MGLYVKQKHIHCKDNAPHPPEGEGRREEGVGWKCGASAAPETPN